MPKRGNQTLVPARRCTATSKRTGQPCRRWAVPGAAVCTTHGGKAPQVVAAAQRRIMAAEAGEILDRLGVAVETTPVEALEAMLAEAAGNVAVLRSVIANLGLNLWQATRHPDGTPTGTGDIHPLISLYNSERDRLANLSVACAKLGLDERRVRLAEAQVDQLLGHLAGAVADIGLDTQTVGRLHQALADRIRGLR